MFHQQKPHVRSYTLKETQPSKFAKKWICFFCLSFVGCDAFKGWINNHSIGPLHAYTNPFLISIFLPHPQFCAYKNHIVLIFHAAPKEPRKTQKCSIWFVPFSITMRNFIFLYSFPKEHYASVVLCKCDDENFLRYTHNAFKRCVNRHYVWHKDNSNKRGQRL